MISEIDKKNYDIIRKNIKNLIQKCAEIYDQQNLLILDVAPQIHEGTKEFFKNSKIETLDIDPKSNSTYICDLCKNNSKIIEDEKFDLVFCTEVLEHTNDPFKAAKEMYRILKKDGVVIASTPFNFRIHNPLPDNWRFTEHGLRIIFSDFTNIDIETLEDPDRFLMPIHYTIVAKK